jgi:hypothetical protein
VGAIGNLLSGKIVMKRTFLSVAWIVALVAEITCRTSGQGQWWRGIGLFEDAPLPPGVFPSSATKTPRATSIAPSLPGAFFDRPDANKDGFVTEEKVKPLWRSRP